MFQKRMLISVVLLISLLMFGFDGMAQEAATPVPDSGPAEIAFVITDKTLAELRQQELPEEVCAQLEPLKDTLFSTEALFVNALEQALGPDALAQYRAALLELAYVYDASGRREPFKPTIEIADDDSEAPTLLAGEECPPPLGQYGIGQFQVIGIVLGEPGDRAKIKAPDGEAYTLVLDACLGQYAGKVIAISENCVTIRETKRYEKGGEVTEQTEDTELCLQSAAK